MGKVSDGSRYDIASPGVFDRHGDSHRNAQIASLSDFGQAAEFTDLKVHNIHGQIASTAKEHFQTIDILVEHKRVVGLPADSEAFFVGYARLFDIDIEVFDSSAYSDRFVLGPTGIGIGDESVGGLECCANGMDALDIDIWITADFELESSVTLGSISRDVCSHLIGRLLGNRAIKMEVVAVATTQ
jgi:hypothetical protein